MKLCTSSHVKTLRKTAESHTIIASGQQLETYTFRNCTEIVKFMLFLELAHPFILKN